MFWPPRPASVAGMPLVLWPPSSPPPPLPARAPSLMVAGLSQVLLLRELLLRRFRKDLRAELATAPRGDGEPVLVLPGMGVGDISTLPIRRYLRRQGLDARGWELGRNSPDAEATLRRLLPRLTTFVAEARQPVALVGWSLGGVVARELARLRPDLVRCLVTLGSPVAGGFRHTAIAGLFRIQGWNLEEIERLVAEANRTPIRVPVTAIWSRRDGIVAWPAAVDSTTPGAVNLEATSCHWALGLDPEVLAALPAALLRRPEDLH
jgi:pimeloyl-ACP methyl ester carboxylesterase